MAAQPHPQPTPEQRAVNENYFNDALLTKADVIVKKATTFQPTSEPSQYFISITKNSEVLIVMDGLEGLIYNSLSIDKINPWLINKIAQRSFPEFRKELNEYWANAKVPADWGIRPFRVYEWNKNESKWEARDLEVDHDNKVVRVTVKDQEFWCHPPRPFQVLENACNANSNKSFKQIDGNLGKALKDFENVDTNEKIPKSRKPERKIKLKTSIDKAVDDLYQLVEELRWDDNTQLTSYRYPTLQMGADKDYQPGNATSQRSRNMNRFRGDSSGGMYRAEDNEVHYRLEEEGTEPIPKPTKEEFLKWVLNRHARKNPDFSTILNHLKEY